MKRIGIILFCLIISITSNSQNRVDSLNSMISEIITYNAALQTFDNYDSLHKFQLEFIKRNTILSDLETVIEHNQFNKSQILFRFM